MVQLPAMICKDQKPFFINSWTHNTTPPFKTPPQINFLRFIHSFSFSFSLHFSFIHTQTHLQRCVLMVDYSISTTTMAISPVYQSHGCIEKKHWWLTNKKVLTNSLLFIHFYSYTFIQTFFIRRSLISM